MRGSMQSYELLFTIVDFSAAVLFIAGSILFFDEDTTYMGTWLFLVGSIFYGLKPCIRLVREWRLLKQGHVDERAERANE
jgi:predicted membrane channel-forming protein YqfA (hemolysin III family)